MTTWTVGCIDEGTSVFLLLPLSGFIVDSIFLGRRGSEMTIDPITALPKDKGWAWMCLVGKVSNSLIIVQTCYK